MSLNNLLQEQCLHLHKYYDEVNNEIMCEDCMEVFSDEECELDIIDREDEDIIDEVEKNLEELNNL